MPSQIGLAFVVRHRENTVMGLLTVRSDRPNGQAEQSHQRQTNKQNRTCSQDHARDQAQKRRTQPCERQMIQQHVNVFRLAQAFEKRAHGIQANGRPILVNLTCTQGRR